MRACYIRIARRRNEAIAHAFQTCVIGSWDEYEQIEETIVPSELNIRADLILERTAKNK